MSPFFFNQTVITVIKKCTFFRKMRLFFQKAFIVNTSPPPTFVLAALCQSCETLYWNLGVLIACHVSARHPQNSILWAYPSGGQEVWSWGVLHWACKEDEEQQATPLLQLLPLCIAWCAVWHYNAGGLYSFSCLATPFNFVVLTAFMSAHIALNWLWHLNISTNKIPSLTQKTLAKTLPAVIFPLNWFSLVLI